MQEYGPNLDAEVLQNKKRIDACDLICMVYDSADANSFSYVASLVEKYKIGHIPIVYIATKSDLDLVAQRHHIQPDLYCRSIGLPVPTSVSMKTTVTADLFNMLIEVCINPYQ
jgi:Ras family protein T1